MGGAKERRHPFVGRAEERAVLSARVSAAAGGRSQVVLVEGDAGHGKSELVAQVVRESCDGFAVLRVEAEELAMDASLYLVGQLGVPMAGGPVATAMGLLEVLAERQDHGPVALVVEDLHWADPASRDSLLLAARRLREDRVLILVTTRPNPVGNSGWERFVRDDERGCRVRLGPLSVDEVARLVDELGIPLHRRGVERLHRHTAGHPLYLRTILGELTPAQLALSGDDLPTPSSLALTTVGRMAERSADARALASALAVLRQRAPLPTVAAVAGQSWPAPALEELVASGFVTWSPAEPGTPIEFVHPLYSTAVYEDLPPTRRQQLHRAAAAVLDPEAAMEHRFRATDTFDDGLAAELDQAAAAKAAAGELGTAATYQLWSSSLSTRAGDRDRRLEGAVWWLLLGAETARAASLRARLEACADSTRRNYLLGVLAWDEGDAAESEKWLRRATAVTGPGLDRASRAAALALLGYLCVTHGRMAEAADLGRLALGAGLEDGRSEYLARYALTVGRGALTGAAASVLLLAGRLPDRPDEVGVDDADLLVLRGTLHFYAQRVEPAIADLAAAVKLLRTGRTASELARAHLKVGQMLFSCGDWIESRRHGEVALSLSSDERQTWVAPQAHALLTSMLAAQGHLDEATDHLNAARTGLEKTDTLEAQATTIMAEADLARARGDSERVLQLLLPFVGEGDAASLTMLSSLLWWVALAMAALDCGQADLGARLTVQLEGAAAMRGLDMDARLLGLRGRVAAETGRVGEALSLFSVSVESFTIDDPIIDQAQIRQAYGRLLAATGQRRRATDQLRAAHELLSVCGAAAYLERLAADLERCGVRANARRSREHFDLTGRERDVAVLVGRGLTNGEVAAELYVSKKAVEFHLGNIFAKLGFTSRRQLRGLQFA